MSALTSPRNFSRYTTGGFDGTTAETAVYTQLRSEWTTPTDSVVGVWSFQALQRAAGDPLAASVASIARVALEGTIDPLVDLVSVLDSTGAVRFSHPASVEGTPWFFLGPQDSIRIRADDATKADLLIQDLNAANLPFWILADATQQNVPVDPLPYSEETLLGAAVVSDWVGRRMEFLSFAGGPGFATLPPAANIALGDEITFLRTPGSQLPTVRIAVGDSVNGLTGGAAAYPIRDTAQSVTLMRVTGGWQRRAGFPVASAFTASVSPAVLPAFQEGTLYVWDAIAAPPAVIQLPALADCTEGCRVVILTSPAGGIVGDVHALEPAGGDTINSLPDPYLYPGGPTIENTVVVAEHAGTSWFVTSNVISTQTTNNAAGAIRAVGGLQTARINLAVNGDVTLPDPALLPDGSSVTVTRVAGAGVPRVITHNGVVTVNGIAGVAATQWYLWRIGDSITYTRTDSAVWTRPAISNQPMPISSGAPIVLTAFRGEQMVTSTGGAGQTITLPPLAQMAVGDKVYLYNSSGAAHVLAAAGGDTVLGAASQPILTSTGFVAYCDGTTNWKGWTTPT